MNHNKWNEEIDNYKNTLNHLLQLSFDEKYIIYKGDYYKKNNDLHLYFSDVCNDNTKTYKTYFTFNYYLLIERKHYKTFKKMNPYIRGISLDYKNPTHYNFNNGMCILAKFIKPHYKKEIINFDGKTYIKIKLRALNNSFIPQLNINFEINNDIWARVKIIAVPVRKRYTNLIKLQQQWPMSNDDLKKFVCVDINEIMSLFYKDGYNEKENSIDHVKNNEKLFFKHYINGNAFLFNNETNIVYSLTLRIQTKTKI